MRRLGVVLGIVVAGGVLAANATAAPSVDHVHLRPASTSVERDCEVPEPPSPVGGPGAVVVTFTVLPPGC